MKPLLTLVGICLLSAACGSSSSTAPTATTPTSTAILTGSPSSFGTSIQTTLAATGTSTDFARCLQGSGETACFRMARVHTLASGGALVAAPTGLVASASGSSVTLAWSAPAATAVAAYVIEAGSSAGLANLANFSTGNAQTSFFATGIGAGSYYVRVRAVGPSGDISAPTSDALLVVGGSGPCTAPGSPSGLALVSSAGGTVVLTWSAAAGSPTSYTVEAGSASGLANLANSDLGLTTSLTAASVGAGTYYVRVRGKNVCGLRSVSNEIVFTVGSTTPTTRTDTVTGNLSGGDGTCSDGLSQKPCRAYPFHVSSAGSVQASLTWAEGADLDLTLWRGSSLIASSRGVTHTEAVSSNVSPGDYELHVTYYSGAVIANFTLTVTHPN